MNKAEAGRLGGLKTKENHPADYYRVIGRKGAEAFYRRYRLEPYGQSYFAIIDRATGRMVKIRKS